ncbi:MAG: hypothetical protein U0361_00035, partial [Nitrospiraceae bacterium]
TIPIQAEPVQRSRGERDEETAANAIISVKDDLVKIQYDRESETQYAAIRLDSSKTPKEIDLIKADSAGRLDLNHRLRSICKLDSDTLVLAIADRPTAFRSVPPTAGRAAAGGVMVVHLRRK